jgi:hypothetical protein
VWVSRIEYLIFWIVLDCIWERESGRLAKSQGQQLQHAEGQQRETWKHHHARKEVFAKKTMHKGCHMLIHGFGRSSGSKKSADLRHIQVNEY